MKDEKTNLTTLRKISKNFTDVLDKKVRYGSSTIIPDPTWSKVSDRTESTILFTGTSTCT